MIDIQKVVAIDVHTHARSVVLPTATIIGASLMKLLLNISNQINALRFKKRQIIIVSEIWLL
jgi:hypothetical protein